MSQYQVLSRKYRPQRFADVVGQEAIVTTLLHALSSNSLAQGYLFSGSHGTGKTTLARLLAKALNCASPESNGEPCNQCSSCREIAASNSLDVIEIDGASHRGIEEMRQINETVAYAPAKGKYKIYLIDEVHMLTKEAFNALLKTLEEPPPTAKFLFATTEVQRVPATILSRCQHFQLRRLSEAKIAEKLETIVRELAIPVEREALLLLARFAEGGMRDAESLLEQLIAFCPTGIAVEGVTALLGILPQEQLFAFDAAGVAGNERFAFELAEAILASGTEVTFALQQLLFHIRTLLALKTGAPLSLEEQMHERYRAAASHYTEEQCLYLIELFLGAQMQFKTLLSKRVALEWVLLRAVRSFRRASLSELLGRLAVLEERCRVPGHVQKPSHGDTVMQFAAKELKGSLRK